MLAKFRNRLAQEEGFTLIELLVVILIIGILAAVAIPTFLTQKSKANGANAKTDVKNAQTVIESYVNGAGGLYPADTTAGTAQKLSVVLSADSDANSLSNVYYVTNSTTASSADSYVISETASGSAGTYWIQQINGTSCYGYSLAGSAPTAPGTLTSGACPSGTTANGWGSN